ncbi:MAG: 2-amino-4-hydroxy-6-hydroxymethyldihydropteridine diphosphokinase [Kiritimatiellae bacterium]|nr:2-amino-4-hydroxy-6-hydroxymethyldihydropteridine diphosphokinase [Kiritimatiellia bacterium]
MNPAAASAAPAGALTESGFSLGSNLGDRLGYLREAARQLAATPGVEILARSPVYETEPVGVRPEHAHRPYLNAVVIAAGPLTAAGWLRRIADIETALGRTRTEDRNAPRTLDIDLIYHGAEMIDSGGIRVPHPRWAERAFVVRPLADVRPELVVPGAGRTVKEILRGLESRPGPAVRRLTSEW